MAKDKDSVYAALSYGKAHPADAKIANFTIKDLKRECVIREMPFMDIITKSFIYLCGFYRDHYHDKKHPELLDKFDKWQEGEIIAKMKETGRKVEAYATSPSLRLGFIGEEDASGKITSTKRIRGISKNPKIKRERTVNNIYAGTKKALTYQLQQTGVSKEDAIKEVMETFPEANEKSISIWYNKSKKISSNGCNLKVKAPVEKEKPVVVEDIKESPKIKKTFRKKHKK